MVSKRFLCLVVFLYFVSLFCGTNGDDTSNDASANAEESDEPFIPTNEWQEVKPGQAIPRGLHVRMDMTDGGKWAKLLDENDVGSSDVQVVPQTKEQSEIQDHSKTNPAYSIEQLKHALNQMKEQKFKNRKDASAESIKSKFRSMDEIRQSFDEMNLQQESDVEVMKKLLSVLRQESVDTRAKLIALKDLEYYVHQVDNAQDLFKIDGFGVVMKSLSSAEAAIREEAAHVIGSAVQSNPTAQIKALEHGVLFELLKLVQNENQPDPVKKKALYAISALIRHFPFAQIKFSEEGGFNALINLFHQNTSRHLQFKAIQLVNDLMEERRTVSLSNDAENVKRKDQYSKLPLTSYIIELGWCPAVASALSNSTHDAREIVLTAMKNLYDVCASEFASAESLERLQFLKTEYTALVEEELRDGETDGYFKVVLQLVDSVLGQVVGSRMSKDEF